MKRFFAIALVAALAVPAIAADVTSVNPSNVIMDQVPAVPHQVNGDPLCGALDFDGVNGYVAQRRPDGLEAWVMANCENVAGELGGFSWYAIDNTDTDWDGSADYGVWDANTVEGGCADDTNTICAGRNIANSREPLLDGGGNQVILFGRLAWIYTVKFDGCSLPSGKLYLAPRIGTGAGQSFILTRACNGDKPTYFQSAFFGFPCAVPGNQIFGVDGCNAIVPLAGGPASPRCTYEVTRSKRKSGLCGQPCNTCPYNEGDLVCTVECQTNDECRASIKGFNACNGGGACKVKANLVGCAVPDGCKRCG